MTADQIIEGILGKEGGYVNNPNDKGGPTRWGITQTTARAYGYTGDMKALPRETAKAIYLSQYWTEPKFDRIAELSPSIAQELCDTGVNMGQALSGPEAGRRNRQFHHRRPEKLSRSSWQRRRSHAAEGAELQPGGSLS